MREEPTLGRAIAMEEFIFVDGVNVRKLIDDLGYLILLNILKSSELVISIAGLYHLITGWKGPGSPFNLSDIRLYIPA